MNHGLLQGPVACDFGVLLRHPTPAPKSLVPAVDDHVRGSRAHEDRRLRQVACSGSTWTSELPNLTDLLLKCWVYEQLEVQVKYSKVVRTTERPARPGNLRLGHIH